VGGAIERTDAGVRVASDQFRVSLPGDACAVFHGATAWCVRANRVVACTSRSHRTVECALVAYRFWRTGCRRRRRRAPPAAPQERARFTDDDARLAHDIAAVVGDQEWVANAGGDGSYWAMHVSGRRFVRPSLWVTMRAGDGSVGDAVDGLLHDPWPDATRALNTAGVAYVYATDHHAGAPRGCIPASYDRDPRFEGVLRGRSSGLYRILWLASQPVEGFLKFYSTGRAARARDQSDAPLRRGPRSPSPPTGHIERSTSGPNR
jgi:hypothetical protein